MREKEAAKVWKHWQRQNKIMPSWHAWPSTFPDSTLKLNRASSKNDSFHRHGPSRPSLWQCFFGGVACQNEVFGEINLGVSLQVPAACGLTLSRLLGPGDPGCLKTCHLQMAKLQLCFMFCCRVLQCNFPLLSFHRKSNKNGLTDTENKELLAVMQVIYTSKELAISRHASFVIIFSNSLI